MFSVSLTFSSFWYSVSCCCIIFRIFVIFRFLAFSSFRNLFRFSVMVFFSSRIRFLVVFVCGGVREVRLG